ncbi:MAG: hypothetical protein L6308_06075 [Candidatus Omnitrophica bacterium]|nr:hypothetical protein [Candidatus Omnitrophota bacterium]
MNFLVKYINILVDLIYCPRPSCEEKPLDKFEVIAFIVVIIGIAFLIWFSKLEG